jgi:hypothetical protein
VSIWSSLETDRPVRNSNKTPYDRTTLMPAIQLTKYGKPEEGLCLVEISEPGDRKSGQVSQGGRVGDFVSPKMTPGRNS